ncbi:rod shape-determining protein MreD [Xenococcus sp. PCC 7305]|uniref:rod shape-determining protein MreD n=1 Tax=Xenococcus sp. PCC 7305 TaxID=102125 RepID=UPI0002ACC61E|nr:rod shape-determining protein MreD [Xenococcus sp. PCC 7305]ELS01572.1 rod shape-determining protein MreD [Xenococcus sp. PCC 7305]
MGSKLDSLLPITHYPNMAVYLSNIFIILSSVTFCSLLLLLDFPGIEILGISPNWILILVIVWSVKRPIWQAAIAGISLGLIYDGITVAPPSHILSLVTVGVIAASFNKQKYIGEDLISVVIITFFLAILAETIVALQYIWEQMLPVSQIWQDYQKIVIISALINSLWTPAIYFPLNKYWKKSKLIN